MAIPRPEHPFPQFQRKDWLSLNGPWEFEIDNARSGRDRRFQDRAHLDSTILVPFCPESALSGVGNTDFMNAVWYQRTLTIPDQWEGKRVYLQFGAVDHHTEVYLNGGLVCVHDGGYTPFSADITDRLQPGENRLTVYAEDDVRSPRQPRGKQSEWYASHGCDYTRVTGIWQTVWLEARPEIHIEQVRYEPDINNACLHLWARVRGGATLTAEAFYEGRPVGRAEAVSTGGTARLCLPLDELHLWEAGQGRLYDLRLTYGDDRADSYFGMRQVRLDGHRFLLNGKSVFQRTVLDQGYYPDGIYTAPNERALIRDIELSLAAGFNGARLHQKVFEPRYLYHCDRLGYLVWGEYGSWGIDLSDRGAAEPLLGSWMEEIQRDYNHPSVIGWCPLNETWDYDGRPQCNEILRLLYQVTKEMDPTRPCIDTSGNFHVVTDIFDVHDYDQNPASFKEKYDRLMTEGVLHDPFSNRQTYRGEAVFLSEYGGIRWSERPGEGWGYGEGPQTPEEFLERYRGLTDALLDNDRLFGFCYTQLYDVEQEQNGLYTYDRRPKFDMDFFRKVNGRKAAIED